LGDLFAGGREGPRCIFQPAPPTDEVGASGDEILVLDSDELLSAGQVSAALSRTGMRRFR
jgi:hypothetical protein